MPGPWDIRAEAARAALSENAAPTPTSRLLFALRKRGLKVVAVDDISETMVYSGTRYTFACGCERLFKVTWHDREESEQVEPCEDHVNLLTSLGGQVHDVPEAAGKNAAEQRTEQTP